MGKIQTETLKEFANIDHWEDYSKYVYQRNYWKRWLPSGITDQTMATLVSGHYCYQGDEYNRIIFNIDLEKFKSVLANKINTLLDNYTMITTQVNLISNLKN